MFNCTKYTFSKIHVIYFLFFKLWFNFFFLFWVDGGAKIVLATLLEQVVQNHVVKDVVEKTERARDLMDSVFTAAISAIKEKDVKLVSRLNL